MEQYDLLIVVDATGSMTNYLNALNTSLPQIISISALTGSFSRIGLLAYRDYRDDNLLEWSGWLHQDGPGEATSQADLIAMAKGLEAGGGGDYPEATKTAFAKAYEVMRSDSKTLVFLYTDAPPHANVPKQERHSNGEAEKESLMKENSYAGFGPSFVDWVSATHMLRSGDKKAQVFSILSRSLGKDVSYYNFMSTLTGGACTLLNESSPEAIAKVTIEILLAWMGVEKPPTTGSTKGNEHNLPANLSRYISGEGIKKVKSEASEEAVLFMRSISSSELTYTTNIAETKLNADSLKKYLPKRPTPVQDFAERWKTDDAYKVTTLQHLLDIMHADVRAIALNPVFGTLWRTICNDRIYPGRERVLEAFSTSLNKLKSPEDKARMKVWLEESYDFTADILEIINKVPQEEKYPCVLLDPTLSFPTLEADANENESDKPITDLTRGDLMEIGRSCHASTLRRLSRILARLTFVNSADEMPAHISNVSLEKVPSIPLALTEQKYGREFWKILLHLIVPGTMLSARPAALVAALSLRLGMGFLFKPAVSQMLVFKDRWNDIETPENWTVGCLTLLIDADEIYQQHQKYLSSKSETQETINLLKPVDRKLFEKLVAFKMLEFNLDTPLTAEVPWTPNKSIDRFDWAFDKLQVLPVSSISHPTPKDRENHIKMRVSTEDTTTSQATWVECFNRSCKAQYVVYNVEGLNVRAKCHYCRALNTQQPRNPKQKPETVPVVQCKQCHNRMIWPKAYRPSGFAESDFVCPPCISGHDPTEEVTLAARKMAVENAFAWLIQDKQNPDTVLFENRSIFHAISTLGLDAFISRIELFPAYKGLLLHHGKPIVNTETLISRIRETVANRQTARTECSLCFSTFHPRDLNPACGRRGCLQRTCTKCLNSWYGLNAPGNIINTAALACPFCRRFPAARTLAKYGMGIHAVRDLVNAAWDKGRMIYAWCRECATAKEYMERDCARGAPPEVKDWTCEECVEDLQHRRIEYERRRVEQRLADAWIAYNAGQIEAAERRREQVERDAENWQMARVQPCPKCGVITQRISGCGHLKCSVSKCETDWCWYCGQAFDELEIYEHMQDVHGGNYGGGGADYMSESEDDE